MKYIFLIILASLTYSCKEEHPTILDINDYFIITLDARKRPKTFYQDGSVGYDVDYNKTYFRIAEIPYTRKDRQLSEHVYLYPEEMYKKRDYKHIKTDQFKSMFLKGSFTQYKDGNTLMSIWYLHHKKRLLMATYATNIPQLSDRQNIEKIIHQVTVNENQNQY